MKYMLYSKTMITLEAKHNIHHPPACLSTRREEALKTPTPARYHPMYFCMFGMPQKKRGIFLIFCVGCISIKSFGTEYQSSCSRSVHNYTMQDPIHPHFFVVVYKLARLYRSRKKDLGIAQQTRAIQVRKATQWAFQEALPGQVPLRP